MLDVAKMELLNITTRKKLERKMIRTLHDQTQVEFINMAQEEESLTNPNTQLQGDIDELLRGVSHGIEKLGINPSSLKSTNPMRFKEEDLETLLTELKTLYAEIQVEINAYDTAITNIKIKMEEAVFLKELSNQMIPLGLDFNLLHNKDDYFYVVVGYLKRNWTKRFIDNLKELSNGQYIIATAPLQKNQDNITIVGVLKDKKDNLEDILSSFGFEEINISETLTGSPQEVLQENEKKIADYELELQQWEVKRVKLVEKYKDQLLAIEEQLILEKQRIDTKSMFQETDYTITMRGWIPVKNRKEIEIIIKKIDPYAIITVENTHHNFKEEDIPVLLKNHTLVKPMEPLVTTYGSPIYGQDWDPSLILAITLSIFFGVMFGDVGHGILLFLLAIFGFTRKADAKGLSGLAYQARWIVLYFSITSIIFGILYGAFFGLEAEHNIFFHALWFSPDKEPITLFYVAILIGALHIALGLALYTLALLRHRKIFHMFFVPLMLLIGYSSAIIAIAAPLSDSIRTLFLGIMAVAILLFIVYEVINHKLEGVGEIMDFLLTLISNTISYSRLFAIAIVHGILATIFVAIFGLEPDANGISTPGQLIANPVYTLELVLALLAGAVIIMTLELAVTSIQGIRLHYVEFFSKMHYEGSGHQFQPFTAERKYTLPETALN